MLQFPWPVLYPGHALSYERLIIFAVLCQDGTSGKTPLHYAVEQGNLPLAGFLILEVSFPCLIASG